MATQQGTRGAGETSYAMAGFIAMAIAVVGMTGILAAQVSRLPLDRVMAREAVLDQALALSRARDTAGLQALRPLLGDSAAAILGRGEPDLVGPGFEARLAAERTAMRLRRAGEADATAGRLRMLLIVVTIMAAGFAAAALLVGRRVAPDRKPG